jgi:hypothetical protein
MKTPLALSAVLLVTAALLAGCESPEGVKLPVDTTKYGYENTSNFVLMDSGAQRSVTPLASRKTGSRWATPGGGERAESETGESSADQL